MVEVNGFVTPEMQDYIDKHAPDDTPINIVYDNCPNVLVIVFFIFIFTPIAMLYIMLKGEK